MGQSEQLIKRRIRSVQSTMKITKAMELVATSKLQKQKGRMEKNKEYADCLYDTMARILAVCNGDESEYVKVKPFNRPLTIIFSGDTGLCGGYHANLFRYVSEVCDVKDPIIAVGSKGIQWARKQGYPMIAEYDGFDHADDADVDAIANQAMELYRRNEISEIRIVYTEFINSVSFEPRTVTLLPMQRMKAQAQAETLFEPSPKEVLEQLIPMYVRSMAYSVFLRSKTAEHASRRMAMENATDNAQELTDNLLLKYNQARQASITQEITEIVAGADAL